MKIAWVVVKIVFFPAMCAVACTHVWQSGLRWEAMFLGIICGSASLTNAETILADYWGLRVTWKGAA